jgi:hypothetical protein
MPDMEDWPGLIDDAQEAFREIYKVLKNSLKGMLGAAEALVKASPIGLALDAFAGAIDAAQAGRNPIGGALFGIAGGLVGDVLGLGGLVAGAALGYGVLLVASGLGVAVSGAVAGGALLLGGVIGYALTSWAIGEAVEAALWKAWDALGSRPVPGWPADGTRPVPKPVPSPVPPTPPSPLPRPSPTPPPADLPSPLAALRLPTLGGIRSPIRPTPTLA